MVVCTDEQRDTLMKAMTDKYGVATEARGLCFAMKVSEAVGFSFEPLPPKDELDNE